jgi:hypothetical protein
LEEREKEKEEREREKEKELIKLTYLGKKKEKRKIIKVNDKSRFVFDWDASEDTSRTLNIPGVAYGLLFSHFLIHLPPLTLLFALFPSLSLSLFSILRVTHCFKFWLIYWFDVL